MINKLRVGEFVTFKKKFDGALLAEYEIHQTYLRNLAGEYVNDGIFNILGVDAEKFCGEAYGYAPIGGKFPAYTVGDFTALRRLLLELSNYCRVEINGETWVNGQKIRVDDLTATLSHSHYASGFTVHSDGGLISRLDSNPSLAQIKRELSSTIESTFKETTMSYIQDKLAALMLTEPTKSFKKLGILTDRNHLNEDGTALFIQYLLSVHGDAFKKDVVDVLLKEEEKKK